MSLTTTTRGGWTSSGLMKLVYIGKRELSFTQSHVYSGEERHLRISQVLVPETSGPASAVAAAVVSVSPMSMKDQNPSSE